MDTERQHLNSSEKIVVGANPLQHFNVRCPSCQKLFRIDSREIKSSQPHYDCSSCKGRFTFDFPPANVNRVETRLVSQAETFTLQETETTAVIGTDLKKCPKCSAINPKPAEECIRCHVIFAKLEELPLDPALGAFPSLMRAWQELLSDYNNLKKHLAFVNRCEDLQALPFALKKYELLKEAQPQDEMAQQMFHSVWMKSLARRVSKQKFIAQINWARVRRLAPFALGTLLILIGFSTTGWRNLVGVGAAILFLTLGLTIFIKGRISLADFW
jgi:hypothetical protein